MDVGGGTPRNVLLITGAKKSHLWCLISFKLPLGFQNFVVINKKISLTKNLWKTVQGSRDPVDLPSTCHPSSSLTTFAFMSWEVKRLLLNLDSYGGTDPLGMCPLFLEEDSRGSGSSSRCGISAAPSFG